MLTIFHNENAAMNIRVRKSLFQSLVIFPAEISTSGIAGSAGRHISKVPDAYREAACMRKRAGRPCSPSVRMPTSLRQVDFLRP